jgi:hypothetical protein
VLTLDSRGAMRFADECPQIASERDTYVYFRRTQAAPQNVAAKVLNRAHIVTVDAELKAGDEGVLACHGSNVGGYVLFVQDGNCTTCTTMSARRNSACRLINRCRPENTRCVTNSNRPAPQT